MLYSDNMQLGSYWYIINSEWVPTRPITSSHPHFMSTQALTYLPGSFTAALCRVTHCDSLATCDVCGGVRDTTVSVCRKSCDICLGSWTRHIATFDVMRCLHKTILMTMCGI